MINDLFYGLVNIVMGLIKIFLIPIDNIISSFLPDLSTALDGVSTLFNTYIAGSIAWVVSLTGLSHATISLIIMYYTFKLTSPIFFYLIKLVISWYNRLKW